ncbi:class I SAM-dependent methyltransferase [Polynucleobacter sp. MWH-UH23A]|uniref:class I SAM-dependent methyltransferase n=1 Tax=Polynucleobacter sp. MWH-UH23A TaxID=1855613 RepID=UPI003364EBA4
MLTQDLVALEENKKTCSWFGAYGIVPHLAHMVKATNILENGVAYVYHADFLCTTLPGIQYVDVDPYLADYDPDDIFSKDVQQLFGEINSQQAMERLFKAVSFNLLRFDGRAKLMKQKSWDAANKFVDESLDLVYIDGDHTYDGVVKDLAAWFPKVRKGGVICGDDIGWPGVKQAVDEFFIRNYQIISKNGFENMPAFYYVIE